MELEYLRLEADYLKEGIKIGAEIRERLNAINELLPECIEEPRKVLDAQSELLPAVEAINALTELLGGRAKYMKRYIDEL